MALVLPADPPRAAVLLLHGSSGQPDLNRARLLAKHGAAVLAPRWFGGPGQSVGICEIPLERFVSAVGQLRQQYPGVPVGVVGVSKGAEAALLTAAADDRIAGVVAMAPTSVAWANVGPGLDGITYPYRSSWSWRHSAVPFVPYDEEWSSDGVALPIAYRGQYERSLVTHADRVADAAIAVERIQGPVLLIGGGDDQLWPTTLFAEQIRRRRAAYGLPTGIVIEDEAGHRAILPGEAPKPANARIAHGGTAAADERLGSAAWPHVLETLGLAAQ
ncbi:MAG: acyl-CoA thioesterase [Hamadaea sp.]|uniref:alpha/beta hydrolase n=1 Tax=Hamadaea sp. TaxID=2024425 RepID=UPI00181B0955|nr:acyl-CoA thioester hydrolase/BAAT C-terminal domain-containing protein [Hamadaea sp.]NUT20978.1 acyl-CoA thioesterase [Hamadaea sp.]